MSELLKPKAWLWRRNYTAGGYTEKVFLIEADALEYAKDGIGLKSPDVLIPLYALEEMKKQVASLEGELDVANKESEEYLRRVTELESGGGE